MKRYEFGLQRVKRVRGVEEDLAKAEFGSAELAARAAEARAAECKAAVDLAVDDLRGLQGSPRLAPTDVIVALGLVDDARRVWFDAEEVAHVARARAEELRRAWQARKRDVDGLERLDGRARADWALERDREEAHALDETAIQRAAGARRSRARTLNNDRIGGGL
jgi:flagellar biosynthesis chaperone FliJ